MLAKKGGQAMPGKDNHFLVADIIEYFSSKFKNYYSSGAREKRGHLLLRRIGYATSISYFSLNFTM